MRLKEKSRMPFTPFLSPVGRGEACLPVGKGEGRRNGDAIFPISATHFEGDPL